MGVRKGLADDEPKAWTRWVCVCHPPAVMPGFGQAPFWLGFSVFTLVTGQHLQRRSYTSDFREAGRGRSLLLRLCFPPLEPRSDLFLTFQSLALKFPMLSGSFPRRSAGPLENRDLQPPSQVHTYEHMEQTDFRAHRQLEFWHVLRVSGLLKKLSPKKTNWSLQNCNDPLPWVTDKVRKF